MAARKQFLTKKQVSPKLRALLTESKTRTVSEAELHEQRISFAYGNAPADAKYITKETVRQSSKKIRLVG